MLRKLSGTLSKSNEFVQINTVKWYRNGYICIYIYISKHLKESGQHIGKNLLESVEPEGEFLGLLLSVAFAIVSISTDS